MLNSPGVEIIIIDSNSTKPKSISNSTMYYTQKSIKYPSSIETPSGSYDPENKSYTINYYNSYSIIFDSSADGVFGIELLGSIVKIYKFNNDFNTFDVCQQVTLNIGLDPSYPSRSDTCEIINNTEYTDDEILDMAFERGYITSGGCMAGVGYIGIVGYGCMVCGYYSDRVKITADSVINDLGILEVSIIQEMYASDSNQFEQLFWISFNTGNVISLQRFAVKSSINVVFYNPLGLNNFNIEYSSSSNSMISEDLAGFVTIIGADCDYNGNPSSDSQILFITYRDLKSIDTDNYGNVLYNSDSISMFDMQNFYNPETGMYIDLYGDPAYSFICDTIPENIIANNFTNSHTLSMTGFSKITWCQGYDYGFSTDVSRVISDWDNTNRTQYTLNMTDFRITNNEYNLFNKISSSGVWWTSTYGFCLINSISGNSAAGYAIQLMLFNNDFTELLDSKYIDITKFYFDSCINVEQNNSNYIGHIPNIIYNDSMCVRYIQPFENHQARYEFWFMTPDFYNKKSIVYIRDIFDSIVYNQNTNKYEIDYNKCTFYDIPVVDSWSDSYYATSYSQVVNTTTWTENS